MRAVSSILSAFIAAVSASAALPPVPARLDSVGDVVAARFHMRLKPCGHGSADWGLVWNLRDSLNYDVAELRLSDSRYADVFGRETASLSLHRIRGGRDSVIFRREFCPSVSPRTDGISLRLRLDRGASMAVLEAGDGRPEVSEPVAIEPCTWSGFYVTTPADTLLRRIELQCRPAAEFASFPDVAALRSHLGVSRDAGEGEWTYYDRNTDPRRLSLGGDYRLATVSDGAGGYVIVYIGGALVNADAWPPLRVKGRLRPTGFIGQYDLWWLDADGEPMGSDCSALMTDGILLDLRFPLHKGSVRMRRVADNKN